MNYMPMISEYLAATGAAALPPAAGPSGAGDGSAGDDEFVYDVYVPVEGGGEEGGDVPVVEVEDVDDLFWQDPEGEDHDSEDSNAESYYANSYPDDEDGDSSDDDGGGEDWCCPAPAGVPSGRRQPGQSGGVRDGERWDDEEYDLTKDSDDEGGGGGATPRKAATGGGGRDALASMLGRGGVGGGSGGSGGSGGASASGASEHTSSSWELTSGRPWSPLVQASDRVLVHLETMDAEDWMGAGEEQDIPVHPANPVPNDAPPRPPPPREGGWGAFGAAFSLAGRGLEAARELLRDKELRRKGAAFLVTRAQEGLTEVQKGLSRNANALAKQISQTVGANKSQVLALMSRLESQITEFQREKQLREHKRQPVDVQIGYDVYRQVPQEVRVRLWMALLLHPDLPVPFRPIQCRGIVHPPPPPFLIGGAGSGSWGASGAGGSSVRGSRGSGSGTSRAALGGGDDGGGGGGSAAAALVAREGGVGGEAGPRLDAAAGSSDIAAADTGTRSVTDTGAPTATATDTPTTTDTRSATGVPTATTTETPTATDTSSVTGAPNATPTDTPTDAPTDVTAAGAPTATDTLVADAMASAPTATATGAASATDAAAAGAVGAPSSRATSPLAALAAAAAAASAAAAAAASAAAAAATAAKASASAAPATAAAAAAAASAEVASAAGAASSGAEQSAEQGAEEGAGHGAEEGAEQSAEQSAELGAAHGAELGAGQVAELGTGHGAELGATLGADQVAERGAELGAVGEGERGRPPIEWPPAEPGTSSDSPVHASSAGGGMSTSARRRLSPGKEPAPRTASASSDRGSLMQGGSHSDGGGTAAGMSFGSGGLEDWEVLSEMQATSIYGFASASDAVQALLKTVLAGGEPPIGGGLGWGGGAGEELSDVQADARERLVQAMLDVPWSAEKGGAPPEYSPYCRFAILNDMTAGQEEVDDIIRRDIHRTFPEHPMFCGEEGGSNAAQEALFRVLKAYSLHDLEVGYCQGMAFAAGIILMYLPQEPAFRLFCRLMDPAGPNLRRMYLPGLNALKTQLACFELLLQQRHPPLFRHIQAHGVPSVLYASQWLMTCFATPFPSHVPARIIDVMLQDGNDRLLLRLALAIMEELESGLMELDDFEMIVTHLKVTPARWGLPMLRKLMDRALASPISDATLELADRTAVAALAEQAISGGAAAAARALVRAQAQALAAQARAAKAAAAADARASGASGGGDGDGDDGGGSGGGAQRDTLDPPAPDAPAASSDPPGGGGAGDGACVLPLLQPDTPSELIDFEGVDASDGVDVARLPSVGALAGLALDDEYMKMIMELGLLTPQERVSHGADAGGSSGNGAGGGSGQPPSRAANDSLL
ncbi:hypothetical protein FOA52_000971 [Chlamydomonas sp. UWO 241]|nr:hypothetical protein FOA52_000971 [Chlamydomonas sp. UWO 241]